jgi:hypothetical protein
MVLNQKWGLMQHRNANLICCSTATFCGVIVLCIAATAYCQDDGTALMLEVSPVQGGYLNLEQGIHNFDLYSDVTLVATPKPGYQFVYWLGDVTDATASNTIVRLDSPKVVIAVFERSKFDLVELEERQQFSRGGGGLIPSAADYSRGGISPVAGRRSPSFHRPKPPEIQDDVPVPEGEEDFPVPEEGDEPPIPVPEPATVTFMLTGLFVLARRRRKRTVMARGLL